MLITLVLIKLIVIELIVIKPTNETHTWPSHTKKKKRIDLIETKW